MKNILLGILIGLTLALSLTLLAGENPLTIAGLLLKGAWGSNYDIGLTLSYVAPLIFTGLSVAVAFHAGLFNIGAEGQLIFATVMTAWLGTQLPPLPFPWGGLILIVAAVFFGAFWGFLPGLLKAFRGSHEVIITIMLNFVAAGLASWVTVNVIPRTDTQNPETLFIPQASSLKSLDFLSKYFPDTPLNASFFLAIVCSLALWVFLWKTRWGFRLRALGANAEAAERSGISKKKYQILALSLAGALAAGVAISEIVFGPGQYRTGFSPEFGFMGIAVALLARNHPVGILFSALLLGMLHKGAMDLDLETQTITRDFSKIMQALILMAAVVPWRKNVR